MAGLAHHFEEGSWGMYPILFWQIIAIGIIIERAWSVTRRGPYITPNC